MITKKIIALLSISVALIYTISSCTKINSSTNIGEDLIPAADGINTFETNLVAEINNKLYNDSTSVDPGDYLAIGNTNDPLFGTTHAEAYLDLANPVQSFYPFGNKDSVVLDSVVLSLQYAGTYGDSTTPKSLEIFEISQNSTFNDSTRYKYTDSTPFLTNINKLGTTTFTPSSLKDTLTLIRGTDTTKVTNQIRIKLNNALGSRFISYDTTNTPNGGYRDNATFKSLFRGLAIKPTSAITDGLVYITGGQATNITVYYRVTKNGVEDTASYKLYHVSNGKSLLGKDYGVANNVVRTRGGEWETYLNNNIAIDDKGYIQSTPGSYVSISIPGLDTLKNVVIHRAELIVPQIANTALNNIYTQPDVLYIDRASKTTDSIFSFENDIAFQFPGPGYALYSPLDFGGVKKSDNTYRFNISRYVQSIVTRKMPNDLLRIHAPLISQFYYYGGLINVQMLDKIAKGRTVIAGGNASNITTGMRLRIIYSKI